MARKGRRNADVGDAVFKDIESRAKEGSSYGYIKLPKGMKMFFVKMNQTVMLDILLYEVTDPTHPDKKRMPESGYWYKRPFRVHKGIGTNYQNVICPTTFGKPCPICEYRQEKIRQGDIDDEEKQQLGYKKHCLYAVIPRGHDNFAEEIHAFEISEFKFQERLDLDVKLDENYRRFPNDDGGYTLRVIFSPKTIGNSKPFPMASRIDFFERDPIPDEVLDKVPNLDEMLDVKTYDELHALLHGIDVADEDDETPFREDEKEDDPDPDAVAPSKAERYATEEEREMKNEEEPEPSRRTRASRSKTDTPHQQEPPQRDMGYTERSRPKTEKDEPEEEDDRPKRRTRSRKEPDDDSQQAYYRKR